MTDRKYPDNGRTQMPNQAHTKSAEQHESAAKSHRAAAEHHGKNDHMKGTEHAAEAQKHSKAAGAPPMSLAQKAFRRNKTMDGGRVCPISTFK